MTIPRSPRLAALVLAVAASAAAAAGLTSAAGCAGPTPPPGPATSPAPAAAAANAPADAAVPALRPVTYERKFAFRENDVLRLTVAADGTYKIVRRGGGGPSSSKAGTLTADQRRKLAAAFAGWDALDTLYPDPGGSDEVYRVTIGYGDKTVTASDAALKVPQTFRDAYKQLREIVSEAGMV